MTWRGRGVVLLWAAGATVLLALVEPHVPGWSAIVLGGLAAIVVDIVWTSQRSPRALPAGAWGVRLVDAGPRPLTVVSELLAVNVELRAARDATLSVPVVVLRGVSRETADELVVALHKRAAAAEVVAAV